MSARTTRAATAGSLALALALALPAAAAADEDRGRSETAPHGQGRTSEQGSAERDAKEQQAERGPDSERRGADQRSASGDPRGNNGTVKIDGEAFDEGRGNEPHVGCTFQVDFYGFDAGDTATLTFTGQAPTGGGLLHSESRTISTDAAGGGQDRDATLTFSVDDQLSELRSVAPHAQQGWHVKLAVDVDSAPGGAKQKVFWIDCPAPVSAGAAAPTTTGTTTGTGTGTGTETTSGTTSDAATGAVSPRSAVASASALPATVVSGTTVAAAERQDALTLGAAGATLAANDVSAQGSVAPSVLPFTGTQGLVWLLATALGALGVGALAHRLGRRATVTSD